VRVGVVGGAGFVGRHVVRHLHETGCEVVTVDVREPSRPVDGARGRHTSHLEPLPRISRWTAKRRVDIDGIWGRDRFVSRAAPTHLVRIERSTDSRPTRCEPLGRMEVLDALLRQTVIPTDVDVARRILSVIAPTARGLRGVRLEIGHDAFGDSGNLDVVERLIS